MTEQKYPTDGDMVVVGDGENYRVIPWPNRSREASIVNLAHDRNEARKEACDAADQRGVNAWDETAGRMELIDCLAGWTAEEPAENVADNSPDVGDDTAKGRAS